MDDSTSERHYEYPGDADAAAGGASRFFDDEADGGPGDHADLKNLREFDLRELALRALAEAQADLPTWGPVKDAPRRQAHVLDESMAGEKAVPVRLQNGSSAWLELTDKGGEVFPEPLRSDRVILAALCTAATIPVDHTNRGDAERLWHSARTYVLLDTKGLMEPFDLGRILEVARRDPQVGSINNLLDAWKLRLHDALIRHYRPDYAALSDEERVVLLVELAKRVDAMLAAVRGLQSFLEEGDATGLPKQRPRGDRYKGADPHRDVLAAQLRDALGLTHRKIAEFLEFPLPDNFDVTGKIPSVKNAIGRGQNLLQQALPDKSEYENYMQRIRPNLKDWYDYWRMIQSETRNQSE